MNLFEAIENRYSARKFTTESIEINDLKELVRRAGMAPSVNNSQPWKYYVVTNGEKIKQISNAHCILVINNENLLCVLTIHLTG